MEVTFTRTAECRYRVSVAGTKIVPSYMEPAPGYDTRLPHDMAHFIVENELGIKGGVFGQLAVGGTACTFVPTEAKKRRKLARRGKRIATANRKDSSLSEQLVWFIGQVWQNKSKVTSFERFAAEDMGRVCRVFDPGSVIWSKLGKRFVAEDIGRVCRAFDAASAVWSKLGIGESMTLVWRGRATRFPRRSRR